MLNETHQQCPTLAAISTRTLLARTPKFIPVPKPIAPRQIAQDCNLFGYRLVKTFNRFVFSSYIQQCKDAARRIGILDWKPLQFPHKPSYYQTYLDHYFDTKRPAGFAWKQNQHICPILPNFIRRWRMATITTTRNLKPVIPRDNLTIEERRHLRMLRNNPDIGYASADKMLGPVVYSRDLYLKQCRLHLEDEIGTYERITGFSVEDILNRVHLQLCSIFTQFQERDHPLRRLGDLFLEWSNYARERRLLCNFYTIWKLHKKANALGVQTRPITASQYFPTAQASHYLDTQLQGFVFQQPSILRDSLSLIRDLDRLSLHRDSDILVISADVAALYPSIHLEDGTKALQWFMQTHTSITAELQQLYLQLARFVLTNTFVQCKGLPDIYRQRIGTAMGTPFSVVYANIFMLWFESRLVQKYQHCLLLYRRQLDDIFLLWSGSLVELQQFILDFDSDGSGPYKSVIKLEWQNIGSTNVLPLQSRNSLRSADFLDITVFADYSTATLRFGYRLFRKPNNAYAYIPRQSYHAKSNFAAWIKAELLRILTHSSKLEFWLEERAFFFNLLRGRGYSYRDLIPTFQSITWTQRTETLRVRNRNRQDAFFETYRACVFTTTLQPGVDQLRRSINLNLSELRASESGSDIFPVKAYFTLRTARRLGSYIPV